MPRTVVYRAGGFTNCGIGYTKFGQEELAEMKDRVMTENEAKAFLKIEKQCINRNCDRNCAKCDIVQKVEDLNSAYDTAIKALEELQQHRAIGTPEEFRAAVEKQTAKKPEFVGARFRNNGKHISDGCQLQKCYKCPNCNKHIFHVWDDELYCKYCGQHIDWRNEE